MHVFVLVLIPFSPPCSLLFCCLLPRFLQCMFWASPPFLPSLFSSLSISFPFPCSIPPSILSPSTSFPCWFPPSPVLPLDHPYFSHFEWHKYILIIINIDDRSRHMGVPRRLQAVPRVLPLDQSSIGLKRAGLSGFL